MTSHSWLARRGRNRSYPLSLKELHIAESARAAAAAEAAAAKAPLPPSTDTDASHPSLSRRISFPIQVRFLSAVQGEDNVELSRLLDNHRSEIDLNLTNHQGLSPLHQAVINRNLDTVKLLLFHGADCNIQDLYGRTPVHSAASIGFRQAVSLMVVFDADIFVLTYDGFTAADVAKDNITTFMISGEMIRQLQHKVFMDKYGFIFRGIEQWERFQGLVTELTQQFWMWFKTVLLFYYQKAIGLEHENSQ